MRNLFILILLAQFTIGNAQKVDAVITSLTKNPIRRTNITLGKSQGAKVQNAPYKGKNDAAKIKAADNPPARVEEQTIAIINNYDVPVKFVIGSNDQMSIQTVEPKSVWQHDVIDTWQNIIIRTNNQDLAYNIRTYNCFNVFFNSNSGVWDLKKAKCSEYSPLPEGTKNDQ